MTPKEKAFELAHKYRLLEIRTSENSFMMISMKDAKQCALIAVDELINSHLLLTTTHDSEPSIRCKTYWQEVKQEIEKL